MERRKLIKLTIAIMATLIVWALPSVCFGMDGLTIIEHRVIALFVFAALMWIFEAIPIWTTSVCVMVLMLMIVSDAQLKFLDYRGVQELSETFGNPISYKMIMASWADPIVMLFMGGFALAIGTTKVGLDLNLARVMLRPFGTRSEIVMLGFMIVTAVFSMFMSNTATAAMMLAILAPVLRQMPGDVKGKTALALSIPIAANVGGIGTPIGTPPNAIAVRYLSENIGFGTWMVVMVPLMIVIMGFAWFLLCKMYPFKERHFELKIGGKFRKDWRAIVVYVTFAVTVLLWSFDKVHGLNSNEVALIPLAVFAVTGIIGKEELKEINWDVLWLVAGGFALGVGLDKSGLAEHMINSIPFGSWPAVAVLLGSGLICFLMSTFMSNTASAALLMPILAAVGKGMSSQLADFGGVSTLLIGVALSASMAMALPISTPPNALAHATGNVEQSDMAKVGILVGLFGIIVGYVFISFGTKMGLL